MAARDRQSKHASSTKQKPAAGSAAKSPSPGGLGRLHGKVAVVTGGNRGIGLAIARALVAEGCSVLITGRDLDRVKECEGGAVHHRIKTQSPSRSACRAM